MQSNTTPRSPIVSTLSIAIALLLFVGLGAATLISGGAIFNPGPVSAKSQPGVELAGYQSHADFENTCGLCHKPLSSGQAPLCLDCHKKVADQIDQETGAHGHLADVTQCAACHAEHKGRDFDPTKAALEAFDHSKTRLALEGKHLAVECKECHAGGRFDRANREWFPCHKEPESHAGMFGQDCARCHSDLGWKPARFEQNGFNHDRTGFVLAKHAKNYDGQPLACKACHNGDVKQSTLPTCVACHTDHDAAFMQKHQAEFGGDCLQCHDGADRMANFDHARVFVLDGKHTDLACEKCHAEQKFHGTPTTCAGCHKEPEIHAGAFGQKCQYCHTSQAWSPALLKEHTFPLNHGADKESDCATCHSGPYQVYTCYTCHDHQPQEIQKSHARLNLDQASLDDCVACHLDGKIKPEQAP